MVTTLAAFLAALALCRPTAALAQSAFLDVPPDHLAHEAVEELASRGITNGYADGTFYGKQALTRSEIVSICQAGQPDPKPVPRRVLRGHTGAVSSLAWSPNSRRLASVGARDGAGKLDGTIRLWDGVTGKQIKEFLPPEGAFCSVCWMGKELVAAIARETDGRVWHLTAQKSICILQRFTDPCVAWSRDGSRMAAWGGASGLRLWDLGGGEPIQSWAGYTVAGAAFSPDGRQLAAVSTDADLVVLDVGTGRQLKVLHKNPGFDFGFSPRGVAWSPDGEYLSASDYRTPDPDGVVRVWEVATGRLRTLLPIQKDPRQDHEIITLAWSPDGKHLAESRGLDTSIRVWNLASGTHRELFTGDMPWSLGWSPDGKRLAAGCLDGTVVVGNLQH